MPTFSNHTPGSYTPRVTSAWLLPYALPGVQVTNSIKTVKAHRARVMEKMNACSLAELVLQSLEMREVP